MNGVIFGDYHSYDDFNLILSSKSIGAPSAKTEMITVPGADGVLDFTEFFGETRYNNRNLTFNFTSIMHYSEQLTQDSAVKNALHGKKVKIILDTDCDFYYIGRVSVGDWTNEKNIGKLTISCDCEPWKYKINPTIINATITDSGTVSLSNLRRSVSPKISTDAPITIAWTGGSASLASGNHWIIPELVLKAGETQVTITGTANVKFEYQEGSL